MIDSRDVEYRLQGNHSCTCELKALIFSITHANENLIDTGTGYNVNSNDPSDRVDNSCATDIPSNTKVMFVLRIEDGLDMKIKCCCIAAMSPEVVGEANPGQKATVTGGTEVDKGTDI